MSDDSPSAFSVRDLPALEWVPKMQRRRLSPFLKMALHCAYESSQHIDTPFETVFSSRHGDLHKTSVLLEELSQNNPLSPTAFSLSVHNALSGLFTIFTKNKQQSNTVAAGKWTFIMGLTDAFVRLKTGTSSNILFVHCDQALPSPYAEFADERQIDHCVAFCLSKEPGSGIELNVQSSTDQNEPEGEIPIALQFLEWLAGEQASLTAGNLTVRKAFNG